MLILCIPFHAPNTRYHAGGQITAGTDIIKFLKDNKIRFKAINTAENVYPQTPLIKKVAKSIFRTILVLYYICRFPNSKYMAFSGYSLSLFEKCFQACLFRIFGRKNLIFLRNNTITNNKPWLQRLYIFAMNRVSLVVFQGRSVVKNLRGLGLKSEISIVKNWLNSEFIPNENPNNNNVDFHFIFIGWLETIKGVSILFETFKKVLPKNKEVFLSILGDGTESKKIQQLRDSFPNQIYWSGWGSKIEIVNLMKTVDYLLLPSLSEGMPNVVIEAMSQSVPAIASKVGAVPDLINDGVDGWLIDPGDEKALELKLLEIISADKNEDLRKNAYTRVLEEHDRNINIRSLVSFLND